MVVSAKDAPEPGSARTAKEQAANQGSQPVEKLATTPLLLDERSVEGNTSITLTDVARDVLGSRINVG